MISRDVITNPCKAAGYYTSEAQRAAEYYRGEEVPSWWTGRAAEAMGLRGPVDARDLTDILQGRVLERIPTNKEQHHDHEQQSDLYANADADLGADALPESYFDQAPRAAASSLNDLRVLSGVQLVHQLGGDEMLLPSDARDYVDQQAAEAAAGGLRRGSGGEHEQGETAGGRGGGSQGQGREGSEEGGEAGGLAAPNTAWRVVELGRVDKNGEREHKAGWDFAISSPKSVSIQALVYGDQTSLAAHRAAAAEALAYLEEHGSVSRIKGALVKTDGLAIATFGHVASRDGDPDAHVHAVISNVTFKDGKAYSLESKKLFEHRRAADAVYHHVLSRKLQKAGFAVQHDAEGRVEISGYSREQIEAFSKRSAAIDAALAAKGLTRETATPAQIEAATLATRARKHLPETRAAHLAHWTAEAEALGMKAATVDAAIAREATSADPRQAARDAVQAATEHLSEREMVFAQRDLHQQAARFAAGSCDWKHIVAELARLEKSGELVRGSDERFTLRSLQRLERDNIARVKAGAGGHLAVMSGLECDRALDDFEARKGFRLTDEQRGAARMILTGDDRFQIVQGLAGTGKTTMLEFVREAAEFKGWALVGHSNGSQQAAKLEEESGIRSTTTAAHLIAAEKGLADLQDSSPAVAPPMRELRIMDEASMAGTRSLARVLRTTEAAGARTVFLGDRLQHQSVEAGRAFEQLQPHAPRRELGEASIRRQKTEQLKQAVRDVLAGRPVDAMKQLDVREIRAEQDKVMARIQARAEKAQTRNGDGTHDQADARKLSDKDRTALRVARAKDNEAVVKQLATDYAALTPEQRANTLVITATNADRKAISEEVRSELKAQGVLAAKGREHATLRAADMTAEQSKRAQFYQPGQHVETMTRTEHHEKGERWEVTRADSRANILYCRDAATGRECMIDPQQLKVRAYDVERSEFVECDAVRFKENHILVGVDGQAVRVRNGQTATIEAVDEHGTRLRIGEGDKAPRITLAADAAVKAEHAYAATSHSAQGQTKNPWIHHNPDAGHHGDREAYVNITRAVDQARIYSPAAEFAAKQWATKLNKAAALDLGLSTDGGSSKPREQSKEKETAAKPSPFQALAEPRRDRTRDDDHAL